jgi:hypothetical protein
MTSWPPSVRALFGLHIPHQSSNRHRHLGALTIHYQYLSSSTHTSFSPLFTYPTGRGDPPPLPIPALRQVRPAAAIRLA